MVQHVLQVLHLISGLLSINLVLPSARKQNICNKQKGRQCCRPFFAFEDFLAFSFVHSALSLKLWTYNHAQWCQIIDLHKVNSGHV